MAKKMTGWKTKGMNRDLSVSAFNPEFSFENMNLRLSTNEGNTLLSWVNEKGTKGIELEITKQDWNNNWPYYEGTSIVNTVGFIAGTPIGSAILDDKLVLFTVNDATQDGQPDYIYVLKYDPWTELVDGSEIKHDRLSGCMLFKGRLNFQVDHPLETLVSYEASHIQKVYWVDGVNQPRVINIDTESTFNKANLSKWNNPYIVNDPDDTFFDFVPYINKDSKSMLSVSKNPSSNGIFAPGVIQYCFAYINKHRQQTNIIATSPLMYISPNDRGGNPEEKISNSFDITITKVDTNFDYVRLYSIQRTSIDAAPITKIVADITVEEPIVYKDTGMTGSSIDPTELLFVGGKEIIDNTMSNKDNTLFLGNITQKNTVIDVLQAYFDEYRNVSGHNGEVHFVDNDPSKVFYLNHTTGIYSHTNTLNKSSDNITTFKGGETYRFGFQLQKRSGEWTEPVFIEDKTNNCYPSTNVFSNKLNLVSAEATLLFDLDATDFDFSPYMKIRPVIVYPNLVDRTVICQGVLNPTVFNAEDRIKNSPFAQASWFFRPYMVNDSSQSGTSQTITPVEVVATSSVHNPDISFDERFDKHLKSMDVWVIVGTPTNNGLTDLLQRKKLRYLLTTDVGTPNAITRTIDVDIHGLIDLGSTKYAVVVQVMVPLSDDVASLTFPQFESAPVYNTTSYSMYNRMTTDGGILRYNASDTPETYIFRFYDTINNEGTAYNYYVVTFHSMSDTDYTVLKCDTSGESLVFTHYAKIPAQADSDVNHKAVEIQGSTNHYDIIPHNSNSSSTPASNSNTQFFIDQSIVTLNSPDIEFDTDVQIASMEGVKLRIVGAIPITSNVSAHSIYTSSAMPELSRSYTFQNIMMGTAGEPTGTFGEGERDINVIHKNIDIMGGNRLISDYLWNDAIVNYDEEDGKVKTSDTRSDYMVYPWQRSGSLNSDSRKNDDASSLLKTKKESHLLFSINSEYFPYYGEAEVTPGVYKEYGRSLNNKTFGNISSQIVLTENSHVMNYRLSKQREYGEVIDGDTREATSEINYYPNIDKVLYNEGGYTPIVNAQGVTLETLYSPVSMKYKSTSHAVIALKAESTYVPLLPYGDGVGQYGAVSEGTYWGNSFWGDYVHFKGQEDYTLDLSFLFKMSSESAHIKLNYLWLAELYKDVDARTRFGGTSKEAVRDNIWCVAGEAQPIQSPAAGSTISVNTLKWTIGDTYYQRYDCLKTYPFTKEDPNQLVEILSFMCETHVNIDGRYDKNRGQTDNTNMSPENFNLLNSVYSQRDNFFTSRKIDNDGLSELIYPNQIFYTKTKTSGADVDLWTNVTLSSMLEVDGDKGAITSLNTFNNNLICFQEQGISQILYNENVQISSTEGVPIELANSGIVQGKKYLNDKVGCDNKWSICQTPSGLYFIDSHDKSIYLFNGQLSNVSVQGGMNSWCKKYLFSTDNIWKNPAFDEEAHTYIGLDGFVSHYDKQNQEVLFVNKDTALAFSEKLGAFTSFYDYGNKPFFANLGSLGLWIVPSYIKNSQTPDWYKRTKIYLHQAGDYCKFFGENKPYWMTLVGNPEPQMDKIFTNLEFRATVEGEGSVVESEGRYIPYLPFDSLEAWDEYQHGITALENRNGHGQFIHGGNISALLRKFRIWRCDIPRDNAVIPEVTPLEEGETDENVIAEYEQALAEREAFINSEHEKGIFRTGRRPLDRMRNPWIYLKLLKEAGEDVLPKVEIHDIVMSYFS